MRMISTWHAYELRPTYDIFHQGADVLKDLSAVCLWTALGAALTGLSFAMGFSGEIGQALGAAG
jgi:hypothetical protein